MSTMKKEDVYYRVALKNMNSIKWAEITKLAHKEVPQTIKNQVNELLQNDGYKKLEAKVGVVRKGKKCSLVLRVKNDGKQLINEVLVKDYTPDENSDQITFDVDQAINFRRASNEVDQKINEVKSFDNTLKKYREELKKSRKEHETLLSKIVPGKTPVELLKKWSTFVGQQCQKLEESAKALAKDAESMKNEAMKFRQGGAGRKAKEYSLDEKHAKELGKLFFTHTEITSELERLAMALGLEIRQFINEMEADVQLAGLDDKNKTEGYLKWLNDTLSNCEKVFKNQRENAFHKNDLEVYLKYDAKRYDIPMVDGGLNLLMTKVEGVNQNYLDAIKRLDLALQRVPQEALQDERVVLAMKKVGEFKSIWGEEYNKFSDRAETARLHLKSVMSELMSN